MQQNNHEVEIRESEIEDPHNSCKSNVSDHCNSHGVKSEGSTLKCKEFCI